MKMPFQEPLGYIKGLDGLRCIACLSVFMVHFHQITQLELQWKIFSLGRLMENGNIGVSLFFILSGFLLALPLWKTTARINYIRFLIKRLARIAPAYYVCLAGLIILQKRWDHTNALHDILRHVVFLHNLSEKSFYNINPPFWTLAVEFQFYLILPVFLYFIHRLKPFSAFILIFLFGGGAYLIHYCIILAVPSIAPVYYINSSGNVIHKSTLAHLPHFFLGVSCGWIHLSFDKIIHKKNIEKGCDIIIGISFFIILFVLSTPIEKNLSLPYGRYNYPLIPFLLAASITVIPFSKFTQRLLETWLFRYIGIISYGIYIYHLPIQHFIARTMKGIGLPVADHWFIFGISSLLISLVVASVSYFSIEKYFLKILKKRI